ncbi:2-(1,2-epoxy-1,2-dihydrophenyl)acetyl-CoA isomerase [bacterium]|nr:2-(1,2-epoxy-1,2-dihydrophenyl)acetyl-CoA isomerase [bacterium]
MIRIEEAGGVLVLTLNRPQVMNALNAPLRRALLEAITGATARVIVLTGAGRGFCAGQDLAEVDPATVDLEAVLREEYEPLIRAIAEAPMPVIAAVNGVAAGAGANLALACDVVIAAESAKFVQAFARIGLVPDAGGSWLLPRQIGMARAMGAMLFAEAVPARQAADWGMIYEAVPDADFAGHWRGRAESLARGPALALGATKRLLRGSFGRSLAEQMAAEAAAQAICGADGDFREAVAAFLDKRVPVFR